MFFGLGGLEGLVGAGLQGAKTAKTLNLSGGIRKRRTKDVVAETDVIERFPCSESGYGFSESGCGLF